MATTIVTVLILTDLFILVEKKSAGRLSNERLDLLTVNIAVFRKSVAIQLPYKLEKSSIPIIVIHTSL
jgi:hypothetical protein